MNKFCKIVMYHYVRPKTNDEYENIKSLEVNEFEKQIKYFKKNFKIIGIDELLTNIHNEKNSDNTILLTFDDGLKDHYEYVYPILKDYQIKGIFFPSVEPLIENNVLDVHKIQFILAMFKEPEKIILECKNFIINNSLTINLDEMKGRMDLNDRFDSKETVFVKKLLQRELERKVRKKLVDFLFKKYVTKDEEEFSKKLYLSLDEIKEMKNSGMAFGSHCYSHEWLDILEENELNFEFERGIEFLKTINCKNKIMCFPYGCYDENILEKMEKFKFDAAFNTEIGNNILDEKIKFKLKRFDCNDFKKCY